MSIKRIVIDASGALKWQLRDEEAIAQADAVVDDFLAGKLELIVPTLFDYEITNALKVAINKKRLSEQEATKSITWFRGLEIPCYDFSGIQESAFQIACRYQRSVYDSAYIALAQSQRLWFYTGDKRLFNAVGNVLPCVKWIGDYHFDSIPGELES